MLLIQVKKDLLVLGPPDCLKLPYKYPVLFYYGSLLCFPLAVLISAHC